jgi:hypothetical protein
MAYFNILISADELDKAALPRTSHSHDGNERPRSPIDGLRTEELVCW